MRRFNLGAVGEADCPVFDGMFEYFQIYAGGSVGGAALLAEGEADVVMNWSGGMHHAKKGVSPAASCFLLEPPVEAEKSQPTNLSLTRSLAHRQPPNK